MTAKKNSVEALTAKAEDIYAGIISAYDELESMERTIAVLSERDYRDVRAQIRARK